MAAHKGSCKHSLRVSLGAIRIKCSLAGVREQAVNSSRAAAADSRINSSLISLNGFAVMSRDKNWDINTRGVNREKYESVTKLSHCYSAGQ